MHADSGYYTWQEGNGPQPEPDIAVTVASYQVLGERILRGPDVPHPTYDARPFSERVMHELETLRADVAILRRGYVDLVETVDGLVQLAQLDHLEADLT
jgi:hypothetical protein